MNIVKSITTLFFITVFSCAVFALPGEGSGTTGAIKENHLAQPICIQDREGVVNRGLGNIMEVGLYNNCDKYTDEEKFCACVSDITYEEKLSRSDLQHFQVNLLEVSKKNIAKKSFESLKDYNEEKLKEVLNMPSSDTDARDNGYARLDCDSTEKLYKKLVDKNKSCSESQLATLGKYLEPSLKNNQKFKPYYSEYMSDYNNVSGDSFLDFPRSWLSAKGFDDTLNNDTHDIYTINKAMASMGLDQVQGSGLGIPTSRGDLQYTELITYIAGELQNKWKGSNTRRSRAKQNAFINSMKNFYLLKGVKGFPQHLWTISDKDSSFEGYLRYFEENLPKGTLDRNNVSVGQIVSSLDSLMKKKQQEKLKNKCDKLIETLGEACSAISDPSPKLSFDFSGAAAKKIRDEIYKEDKFKFDQLYCVSKNKKSSSIAKSNSLPINMSLFSADKSKNLKLVSDQELGSFNFSVGISKDDSMRLTNDGRPSIGPSSSKSIGGSNSSRSSEDYISSALRRRMDLVVPMQYKSESLDMVITRKVNGEKIVDTKTASIQERVPASIEQSTENTSEVAAEISSGPTDESNRNDDGAIFNSTSEKINSSDEFIKSSLSGPKSSTSSFGFSGSRNNSIYNNASNRPEATKEELMENRIEELESRLEESLAANKSEGRGLSPSDESIATAEGELTKEEQEVNELKLELEKMKLELAKTELEQKKKELEKETREQVAVKNAQTEKKSTSSPLNKALSNNAFNSVVKRKNEPSTMRDSSSRASTSRAISSPISTPPSSSTVSTAAPTAEANSSRAVGSTSNSAKGSSSSLLTATSVDDVQLSRSVNTNVVSYENLSELKLVDQSELERLYLEFGPEFITQGGEEITLEKDEATGELRAVEKVLTAKSKVTTKRKPASIAPKESKESSRKRFSLEEFNELIDNGVKK